MCYSNQDCSDYSQMKNMIDQIELMCDNSLATDMLIDSWYQYIQTPVSPSVKYARPVGRILNSRVSDSSSIKVCTIYHAFVYGDIDVALSESNPIEKYIDLRAKLNDNTILDKDEKDAAIKYIQALNDVVYECKECHAPYCPSRQEIADEIQKRKTKRANKASKYSEDSNQNGSRLSSALIESLQILADEADEGCVDSDLLESIRSCSTSNPRVNWTEEWNKFMSQETSVKGRSMYDALAEDDYAALESCDSSNMLSKLNMHSLLVHHDVSKRDKCRKIVSQINIMAQFQTQFKGHVGDKLESLASRLANDIMSGRSHDLTQIGQEFISECTDEDILGITKKIGSIIPTLKKGIPPQYDSHIAPMLQMLGSSNSN